MKYFADAPKTSFLDRILAEDFHVYEFNIDDYHLENGFFFQYYEKNRYADNGNL